MARANQPEPAVFMHVRFFLSCTEFPADIYIYICRMTLQPVKLSSVYGRLANFQSPFISGITNIHTKKKSMPDKTPHSHISQYFSVDVNFIWLQFSHYSQSTELYECIMSYIGHIHGFYCMEFYCSVQMSACVVVERSLIIYFRYFVTKQS